MDENVELANTSEPWQYSADNIKGVILAVRGMQVLLDSDVARLYGYEVKRINETAARTVKRFPEHFRFCLTQDELAQLLLTQHNTSNAPQRMRSQFATTSKRNARYLPFVYTGQGIGMLSGLLKNETAISVSINIMDAFVEMRRFISSNQDVFAKTINIDNKLLEHDQKFDEVFNLLQQPEAIKQSILYKGQFYSAYKLVVSLIEQASSSKDFHDRFLMLDNKEVCVFGASFKGLGNKCFGVFKSEDCHDFLLQLEAVQLPKGAE